MSFAALHKHTKPVVVCGYPPTLKSRPLTSEWVAESMITARLRMRRSITAAWIILSRHSVGGAGYQAILRCYSADGSSDSTELRDRTLTLSPAGLDPRENVSHLITA